MRNALVSWKIFSPNLDAWRGAGHVFGLDLGQLEPFSQPLPVFTDLRLLLVPSAYDKGPWAK